MEAPVWRAGSLYQVQGMQARQLREERCDIGALKLKLKETVDGEAECLQVACRADHLKQKLLKQCVLTLFQ